MLVDRRMNSSSNASRPPIRWPPGIPERSRQATASSILLGSSSVRFMAIRKVRAVALGEWNRGSTDADAGRAVVTSFVSFFGVNAWLAKAMGLPQGNVPSNQAVMTKREIGYLNVNLLRTGLGSPEVLPVSPGAG